MAFTRDNFVVYDEEMHTGVVEVLDQATIDLNTSANGVMSFVTDTMRGDFLKESFFRDIDGLVRDRDPNDTADITADDLTMGEEVSAKMFRTILVEKALSAMSALGSTPEVFSFAVGQIQGKRMAADYLNSGIAAASAALRSNADVVYNATAITGRETISPQNLNRVKKRLGDASQRVRAWIMDSTMYHDLVEDQIESNITDVASAVVYGGSPASLGLPVIVTDSDALFIADPAGDGTEPDQHIVLALTEGAVEIIEAEERATHSEVVSGKANLLARIQNEYTLMAKVSGCSYTGTAAPTQAELGDPANWNMVMSAKNSAGAIGLFNAIDETT